MFNRMSQEDLEIVGQNEVENEIVEKYSRLSRQIIKRGRMPAYSEIHDFINDLRDKYSLEAVSQCKMYHAMIGSGVLPEQVSQFDFEGEDSVALFLDRLAEKYLKEPTGE